MKTNSLISGKNYAFLKIIMSLTFLLLCFNTSLAQLSGSYTIGTGGDYPTLKSAANDLMNQGISGPVTMNILSGTYNEHFVIDGIIGTSNVNTVTFQSAAGHPDSVWISYNATGTDSNYVVKLDNVQYVTFSNITFHGAGQYHSRIFDINATGTATTNITINNNIFHGDSLSSNSANRAIIFSNDPDVENIHILGNTFYGGSSAIFLQGHNYNFIGGTNIISNTFHNVVYCCVNISYQNAPIIANNQIESNQYGIWVHLGVGSLKIRENRIKAGHCGIRVGNVDASGGDRSIIVNNFVSVRGRRGISIANPVDLDIFHNSVFVNDDYFDTRAFECTSPYSYSNINVINNNFVSMEAGYAYYVQYGTAINVSDHNNLYTPGNYIAHRDSNIINLEKLQTVSGKNLNSLSVYPHYTSDTDLHTIAPWLDNKGTNLNYVTRDIDGENRHPVTPDIGADEFSSNPLSIPYSNDLTVGSGGDFASINEAVDSLLLRGVTDSIHINIEPAVYNEQIDLLPIPGTSALNRLTFRTDPASADTAEISFASLDQDSNYTLRLKGADFIKIKNLKITATGANYARVIDLYRGVNSLKIENCVLQGVFGSGSDADKILLYSQDSYYLNRIIQNNVFKNGTYGILMRRNQNNFLYAQNPEIMNNRFNNIGYCGVFLQYTDFANIHENDINAASSGIWISSTDNRVSIFKNKINVENSYGIRLSNCFGLPGVPSYIVNNFVHVGGSGSARGIDINNCFSTRIYHNSVHVSSTNQSDGRAFYLSSGNSGYLLIYNNIFANSGGGYAYYLDNINAITESNYNDLYTSGSILAHYLGGRADLATFQAASGLDSNSVSADPQFVSNFDLHTNATILDSAATYINVQEDIDGQLRDQNFPDIGADEFGFFPNQDPVITSSPTIIARVDSLYEYQVTANDPDGDSLHFSFTYAPNFLSIDSLSGLITGIPSISDTGDFPIEITVSDRQGGFDYQIYMLHVIALPLFTIDPVSGSIIDLYRSSISWGDYDNDGDLDVLITGFDTQNLFFSKIYRNDANAFTDINANIQGVSVGTTDWGDYDNDGDLDILISGGYRDNNGNWHQISKIYRNDSGIFVDIDADLYNLSSASVDFGDYDNDGDLDIILTGYTDENIPHAVTKIYRNDEGVFNDINATLEAVHTSSVQWGDYDNDGDLDILLAGRYYNNNDEVYITKIYRNDNGRFVDINAVIPGVFYGSVDWGDYDNDGDLDILIVGLIGYSREISRIYQNVSGNFEYQDLELTGVGYSSCEWGDYDNDGDLDILLCGSFRDSVVTYVTKIYRNDYWQFTDINAGFWCVANGDVSWSDYDNDGDLDVCISGEDENNNPNTIIYRNNLNSINLAPSAPLNLNWRFLNSKISLNWDESNDQETPQDGLSYNLKIGSSPGGYEVKSPMSNSDGYRQIVDMGNINQATSWSLKNASSNIFWSVQAIDNGFAGSPFSVEDTVILAGLIRKISDVPNDQGGRVSIRWQASELDNNVNILQHYSIWRAIQITEKITKEQKSSELQKSLSGNENNQYIEINGESYYWEWVADQPAHRLPYYSYTCETLNDSMSTTNGIHYFMISAHTSDPNIFFDSSPDSGYSVDNIAPTAPANLNGMYNNNQIALHWNPNSENDFKEYVLYRSLTPNVDPAVDTVFATTTDTLFTDVNILPSTNIYYIVCARDIHDNLSAASNEIDIVITGIIKDGLEIPKSYALYQNYPNPFNPYTIIKFDLPKKALVKVVVFNALGKTVGTIINEPLSPGKYQYIWKPENLASGLYFYTIQTEDFKSVKKMLLVK